jgi:hypothetical protein
MQRFLGILLSFTLLAGCKSDRPASVIDEKVMTDLLLDIHLVDGYLYSWSSDSTQIKSAEFVEGIYQHYGTDSSTVRESLEYYARHPQELNAIYTEVDRRLKEMELTVREVSDKKYREIYVADSIRNAFVSDSLRKIRTDSVKYARIKNVVFRDPSDSTAKKPEPWSWRKNPILSEKLLLPDSVRAAIPRRGEPVSPMPLPLEAE